MCLHLGRENTFSVCVLLLSVLVYILSLVCLVVLLYPVSSLRVALHNGFPLVVVRF